LCQKLSGFSSIFPEKAAFTFIGLRENIKT